MSADALLGMQSAAGNRAMTSLLRSEVERAPATDDEAAGPQVGAEGLVVSPTGDAPQIPSEEEAEGSAGIAVWRAADHPHRSPWADQVPDASGREPSPSPWAATGEPGLAAPAPVSWAALQSLDGDGANAIPGPSTVPLNTIQNADGVNNWRLGWTSFPIGSFKAPAFDFKTSSKVDKAGVTHWHAKPEFTQRAFEGNSNCWYVAAGTHATTHVEKGKPVFWKMPPAMASRDRRAEGEHSRDYKRAYRISLREADRVLRRRIVGRRFGPEATEAAVKAKVLGRITAKLTHPGLGNDQTKWGTIYDTLYRKSLQRDNKGWHSFALGNRQETKTKVFYTIQAGTTNVGSVSSNTIVTY